MNRELEREIIYCLKELSEIPENTKAKKIYDKYMADHTEINGVFIYNNDVINWYVRMRDNQLIDGQSPLLVNIKELRVKYKTQLRESKNIVEEIATGKYCEDVKRCLDLLEE